MEELYETKTSYREIAKEWVASSNSVFDNWQVWWVYTLLNLALIVAYHTGGYAPLLPIEAHYVIEILTAYLTYAHWGVDNA